MKADGRGERSPRALTQTRKMKTGNWRESNPDLPERPWQHRNNQPPSEKGSAMFPTGRRNGRGLFIAMGAEGGGGGAPPMALSVGGGTMPWIRTLKVKKLWRSNRVSFTPQTRIP